MTGAEQLFWGEVRSEHATARSLAYCYALLIALQSRRLAAELPADGGFWLAINRAVNTRFGWSLPADMRKIDRFRKMAWDIHDAAVKAWADEAS